MASSLTTSGRGEVGEVEVEDDEEPSNGHLIPSSNLLLHEGEDEDGRLVVRGEGTVGSETDDRDAANYSIAASTSPTNGDANVDANVDAAATDDDVHHHPTTPTTPLLITSSSTDDFTIPRTPSRTTMMTMRTPSTLPTSSRYNNENGFISTVTTAAATSKTNNNTATATATTLVALFGGPSINMNNGDNNNNNNLAATNHHNHDYTLVGDSPYETTYDPRSPYYYNRVYGQLYITTVSVMFRGKAFGPIGAIPYERRLLLPFQESSTIESYRTTSIKIIMNDGETYVFKSFLNRDGIVKLLKRTQRRCCSLSRNTNNNVNMNMDMNKSVDSIPLNGVRNDIIHQDEENNDEDNEHRSSDSSSSSSATACSQQQENSSRRRKPHNHNNHDGRRRSQSVPSSLRTSSKTATASRSFIVFDDNVINNNNDDDDDDDVKSPTSISSLSPAKMAKTKRSAQQPQKQMPVESLRLSIVGNGDGGTTSTTSDADAGDAHSDTTARPRRLFDAKSSNMAIAMTAIAAPTITTVMSPPRMTISKRRLPITPVVVVNNRINANHNNNINTNMNINMLHQTNAQQLQQTRQPLSTAAMATIPSIPTVPSLNTPEPRFKAKVIVINGTSIGESSVVIATTPAPAIPVMVTSTTSILTTAAVAAVVIDAASSTTTDTPRVAVAMTTPIAANYRNYNNKDLRGRRGVEQQQQEQDLNAKRSWLASIKKKNEEWKVALEPTKLPHCTLNEWFDLFFSDDATFSLANYQIEEVGDRDVQFDPWRRKTKKKTNEGYNDDDADDDGIPELEREIRYIHPINSGIGPSEAETFRHQSLKRYGRYGAILQNVTTVGKAVPMGDCFRVEDKWIIEQKQEQQQHQGSHQQENFLTLSVFFRTVFVKRTMFKSIIQKNAISETKKWFQGYSAMIQKALSSEEHQRQQRTQHRENAVVSAALSTRSGTPSSSEAIASLSSSSSPDDLLNTTTTILDGQKFISEDDADIDADDPLPMMGSIPADITSNSVNNLRTIKESGDYSCGNDDGVVRKNSLFGLFGKFLGGLVPVPVATSGDHRQQYRLSKAIDEGEQQAENAMARIILPIMTAFLFGLLAIIVSLWFQVTSISTSLSTVEGQLGDLHEQNTILLQHIEELSSSVVTIAAAAAAAASTVASTRTCSMNSNHHPVADIIKE